MFSNTGSQLFRKGDSHQLLDGKGIFLNLVFTYRGQLNKNSSPLSSHLLPPPSLSLHFGQPL